MVVLNKTFVAFILFSIFILLVAKTSAKETFSGQGTDVLDKDPLNPSSIPPPESKPTPSPAPTRREEEKPLQKAQEYTRQAGGSISETVRSTWNRLYYHEYFIHGLLVLLYAAIALNYRDYLEANMNVTYGMILSLVLFFYYYDSHVLPVLVRMGIRGPRGPGNRVLPYRSKSVGGTPLDSAKESVKKAASDAKGLARKVLNNVNGGPKN